ncbi:unnamed protein product [Pieris macdunnoughi]|uniref:Uncharacterized protein n=1 Tax=Pieris macdunnoughi TaxID=345717 RepID=A0A821XDW6_9NEOP|nr:unnamed protein product [Pieris macdunnoughi]
MSVLATLMPSFSFNTQQQVTTSQHPSYRKPVHHHAASTYAWYPLPQHTAAFQHAEPICSMADNFKLTTNYATSASSTPPGTGKPLPQHNCVKQLDRPIFGGIYCSHTYNLRFQSLR